MARLFKEKRFDLVWLGEIHEDGTEEYGYSVGTSKSLVGIRKYARMKKLTDNDHVIEEIGPEVIGTYNVEDVIATHRINP